MLSIKIHNTYRPMGVHDSKYIIGDNKIALFSLITICAILESSSC